MIEAEDEARMNTKECPSCGTDVPVSATRCKTCFHDFTEDEEIKRSGMSGPLALLGAFAAMAVVGALTFWMISSQPLDQRIFVDGDTQSVVWTTKYRTGVETERLAFNDVVKLEYVMRANGGFAVQAVTVQGDRKVIHEDERPLRTEATRYAKLMDKDLEEVDNTRGFHKME